MHPTIPELDAIVTAAHESEDAVEAAIGDNYLLEQRVAPNRQQRYESDHSPADTTFDGWLDSHQGYVKNVLSLAPDTFNAGSAAALDSVVRAPDQLVLRLEALDWVLRGQGFGLPELDDWLRQATGSGGTRDAQARRAEAGAALDHFCDQWNAMRDRRPMFGTFWDELADCVEEADWPHLVRDRLGLAHIDPISGPIPVALMSYRVREVVQQVNDVDGALFQVPTVLDGSLYEWFFPSPPSPPFGRAVGLAAVDEPAQLCAEVLHPRIAYRPEHIYKLGVVSKVNPDLDLAERRRDHLFLLQYELDDDGWGVFGDG